MECGWRVSVRWRDQHLNLAVITPPRRSGANPRYIVGWHFRNLNNTGPNQVGPLNVNAPGLTREFIFALSVPAAEELWKNPRHSAPVGSGHISVRDLRLDRLVPDKSAVIASMSFEVHLEWPPDSQETDT
jgi:hypothetical protein